MHQTKAYSPSPLSVPFGANLSQEISAWLAHSSQLLDDENFLEWLALTTACFSYTITTYSPEIESDVVFLEKDRKGLVRLFDQLSMHERYPDTFRRILSVSRITDVTPQSCDVVTPLSVFHTDLGGATGLYCVGVYTDRFELNTASGPILAMRKVKLDTRRLPFGSHIPI